MVNSTDQATGLPTDLQTELPTDLMQLPGAFAEAFNAGNLEILRMLFDPQAMRVLSPGKFQAGDELWDTGEETLAHRLPISLKVRHAYTVGDTALMIIDYVHEGTGPDGKHVKIEGTAADIARRGADGVWRCLISNPSGTGKA
ncbi:nuclear transport factor 2 family protein [Streptomyces sp. NPDC021622]|uniref:YybH family protein n=1 Tax=Streptomyces sp. NPDC021622 TaxID=3155013 RepID=UPI00340CE8AF